MYVLIFFVLVVSMLGVRREEDNVNAAIVFGLSCICATLLYSFRFA